MDIKDIVPGAEIVIPGFVSLNNYGDFSHTRYEMPEHGYTAIAPYEIRVVVPEGFNVVTEYVKVIDAEMETARKELTDKLQVLQQKKNELLQISYAGNAILDPE